MQITVTFDSLEEFKEYMGIESPSKIAQAPQEAPKKSEAKKAPEKVEKPAEEAPAKQDEASAAAPAKKSDIGETEVRVLLSEKLKAGKKAQVKKLFTKYGVEKLSELIEQHPDKLEEIYKEAEGI